MSDIKFVNLGDTHVGYERTLINNALRPIHNQRAIDGVIEFIHDYKPNRINFMGDGPDCSAISHWNRGKRRSIEGLRLSTDLNEFKSRVFHPIIQAAGPDCEYHYVEGNHEFWIRLLLEDYPALEDIIDFTEFMEFKKHGWRFHRMGSVIRMGMWYGIHGENLPNSDSIAKKAVTDYESCIRIWHNHTYQVYTKRTSVDLTVVKNGISVPGLCNRAPGYGKKAPNRWCHGFNWGEVYGGGYFTDHVTIITEKGFRFQGKTYAAPSNRLISIPSKNVKHKKAA